MGMHPFRSSKKRAKFILVVTLFTLFTLPTYTFASIIFETTGWITGTEGLSFEFEADVSPYTYKVTLSDLSVDSFFGFEFLFLSLTTATDTIDSIIGPGSFSFIAVPGETYFANVFGTGGGSVGAGLFGVEVSNIPIPGAAWLLGIGYLSLLRLKKRIK